MNKLDNIDAATINELRDFFHNEAVNAGWHVKPDAVKTMLQDIDPELGDYFEMMRDLAYISLIHSEASETVEGRRKNLMDDHLKHRPAPEVEMADTVIRIFDFCGRRGYDIGGAMVEKAAYNRQRKDHKLEVRSQVGGKQF